MHRYHQDRAYINRIIKKKEVEKELRNHHSRLKQIKSTNFNETFTEVSSNKKKMLPFWNINPQIERENKILLQKISCAMSRKQTKKKNNLQSTHNSLNFVSRKKELELIEFQNTKMLKRIREKKSQYNRKSLDLEWRKQKYFSQNLSCYPSKKEFSKQKKRKCHKKSLNKTLNNFEMMRVRAIDEVTFLVSIKLCQAKLTIIGDNKKESQVKIIEIPRVLAEEFIKEECYGRIEGLFDLLRYDSKEGVLCLIGHQIYQKKEEQKAEERAEEQQPKSTQLNAEQKQQKSIIRKQAETSKIEVNKENVEKRIQSEQKQQEKQQKHNQQVSKPEQKQQIQYNKQQKKQLDAKVQNKISNQKAQQKQQAKKEQ